jgi:DNA-binding GntR family transcriptional regulator
MNESAAASLSVKDGPAELFASSPVVLLVFEQILAAVHRGELQPGERISDAAIASEYGVSRTPVREALQRLREIGVIEASASRFTRVAIVTPEQTLESYTVWLALFAAVIEEVVPTAPAYVADQLEADADAFADTFANRVTGEWDVNQLASLNYQFFARITGLSRNSALLRALNSVVHVIRLGGQVLPVALDLEALSSAQRLMVEAIRNQDIKIARQAHIRLGGIEVPLSE